MECVSAGEDSLQCPQKLAVTSWCAEENVEYYIAISGTNNKFGTGSLIIQESEEKTCISKIQKYIPYLKNYLFFFISIDSSGLSCILPTYIQINETNPIFTSNERLLSKNIIPFPRECSLLDFEQNYFFWFSWIGTGEILHVSVESRDLDSIFLFVFKGSCFNLQCFSYENENLLSSQYIVSNIDETYIIAISSLEYNEINDFQRISFDFNAEILPFIPNSNCNTSLNNIISSSTVIYGDISNVPLTEVNVPNCDNKLSSSQIAWYSILGNDKKININVLSSCFKIQFNIYESKSSSCNDMQCLSIVDSNQEDQLLSFCGKSNSNYYLLITNQEEIKTNHFGEFSIEILYDEDCLFNNCYQNAIELSLNTMEFVDTRLNNNNDRLYSCNQVYEGFGSAWYLFYGTGHLISFTIHSNQNDINILIFSSENDNNDMNLCVNGKTLNSTLNSIEFCTSPVRKYWISIGGTNENIGNIEFILQEERGCIESDNDYCFESKRINTKNQVIHGDNSYSGGENQIIYCENNNNNISFFSPHYSWYSFTGSGKSITITFCSSDFSGIIGVFESSCEYVVCMNNDYDNDNSNQHSLCASNQNSYRFEFCAFTDIEYFILLASNYQIDNQISSFSNGGHFDLDIHEYNSCIQHYDVCTSSKRIIIPSETIGSTFHPSDIDFEVYKIPLSCINDNNDDDDEVFINTQWYSLYSNQSKIIDIQIESLTNSFELITGLYISKCNLKLTECLPSFIKTKTEENKNHYQICGDYNNIIYILITGNNDTRGNFSINTNYLDISCGIDSLENQCESAYSISTFPIQILGDASNKIPFFDFPCMLSDDFYQSINNNNNNNILIGHSWYVLDGHNSLIHIDYCLNDQNNFKFIIFENECINDNTNECLFINNNLSSCSVDFCGILNNQYYILMTSVGYPIVDEYKFDFYESEICVSVPDSPNVFIDEIHNEFIQYSWNIPYSYNFDILYYQYRLYDENHQIISIGETTETKIKINQLQSNHLYQFEIFAKNQIGNGEITNIFTKTSIGNCSPYSNLIQNSKLDSNGGYSNKKQQILRGNIISSTNNGIIHTIKIPIGSYDQIFNISLYESHLLLNETVLSYFTLKESSNHFELLEDIGKNIPSIRFSNLNWKICDQKNYFIAIYMIGELYQSNESVSSCLEFNNGVLYDHNPLLLSFDYFWYDSYEMNENLFTFWLDITFDPKLTIYDDISKIQPDPVEITSIKTFYQSIQIEWNEPCSYYPIDKYIIQILPSFREIIIPSSERSYILDHLSEGMYDISMIACSIGGQSHLSSKIVQVDAMIPYEIQSYSAPAGDYTVFNEGIKSDINGNYYLFGSFSGTMETKDKYSISSYNSRVDGFLIKKNTNLINIRDNNANSGDFTLQFGQSLIGDCFINDISIDLFGNIYVVGYFRNELIVDKNINLFAPAGITNSFLIAYSSTGDLLYYKQFSNSKSYNNQANKIQINNRNGLLSIIGDFESSDDCYLIYHQFNETLNDKKIKINNNHYKYSKNIYLLTINIENGDFINFIPLYGSNHSISSIDFISINDNLYILGEFTNFINVNDQLYLITNENSHSNLFITKFNILTNKLLNIDYLIGFGSNLNDFGFSLQYYHDNNNLFFDYLFLSCIFEDSTIYQLQSQFNSNIESEKIEIKELDNNTRLLALHSNTGEIIWKKSLPNQGRIKNIDIHDNKMIISGDYYKNHPLQLINSFLYSIDIYSGDILWNYYPHSNLYYFNNSASDILMNDHSIIMIGHFSGSISFSCSESLFTFGDSDLYIVQFIDKNYDGIIKSNQKQAESFVPGVGIIPEDEDEEDDENNDSHDGENNDDHLPSDNPGRDDNTLVGSIDESNFFNLLSLNRNNSRILIDSKGIIQYPPRGSNYDNNFEYYWLISPPTAKQILITFEYLFLSDEYDSLRFYSDPETLLGYYNGKNTFIYKEKNQFISYDNSLQIQSQTNEILIEFKTSSCFNDIGFYLTYEIQNSDDCSSFESLFTLPYGEILSIPPFYLDNSDCWYEIEISFEFSYILLDFIEFSLEKNDYIEIYDYSNKELNLLIRFYGNDTIFPLQSIGNSIKIHFVSNSNEFDRGFVIKYQGIKESLYCKSKEIQSNLNHGIIESNSYSSDNYLPYQTCSWEISTNEYDYDSIYLYFNELNISNSSELIINLNDNNINKKSQNNNEEIIITKDNDIYIIPQSFFELNFNANGYQDHGFIGKYCAHPKHGFCLDSQIITTNDDNPINKIQFDNHFCGLYYENNANCNWIYINENISFDNDNESYIMITFPLVDFINDDYENPDDYIIIYDGNINYPSHEIIKLSNKQNSSLNQPTFIIQQSSIRIHFKSNEEKIGKGFNATICVHDKNDNNNNNSLSTCSNKENKLSSPYGSFNNYFCDKIYEANALCNWKIEEKYDPIILSMIIIKNLKFPYEDNQNNSWNDKLNIYEYSQLYKSFHYGNLMDDDIEILSFYHSNISLEFISDDIGFENGFDGYYCLFKENDERLCKSNEIFTQKTNEKEQIISNQVCNDFYQPKANCNYIIKSNLQYTDIILYIYKIEIKKNDSLSIYNNNNKEKSNLIQIVNEFNSNDYVNISYENPYDYLWRK